MVFFRSDNYQWHCSVTYQNRPWIIGGGRFVYNSYQNLEKSIQNLEFFIFVKPDYGDPNNWNSVISSENRSWRRESNLPVGLTGHSCVVHRNKIWVC